MALTSTSNRSIFYCSTLEKMYEALKKRAVNKALLINYGNFVFLMKMSNPQNSQVILFSEKLTTL